MQFDVGLIIGLAMVAALTFYALTGGADFGGGVWDLFAFGPRAQAQRQTIVRAISPIWEANHVWLILVIVLLFTCFPSAFFSICVALHIPLTILLFGIIMRGSAFVFRSYGSQSGGEQRLWGRVFAVSSCLTPILLGIVIGAISNDRLRTTGQNFYSIFIDAWFQPFPFAVGFLALALFAYLAAVYLTLDTADANVQSDFRMRALISFFISALIAVVVFVLARSEAPGIYDHLHRSYPELAVTAIFAGLALFSLLKRRYKLARAFAAVQITMILWGWVASQYPFLVRPDVTIHDAAANERTLQLVIIALAFGAAVLFPSLLYLYRVFKAEQAPERTQ